MTNTSGFTAGELAFKSLGTPVIASRLNAMNCQSLMDKVMAQVKRLESQAFILLVSFFILPMDCYQEG